MGFFFTEAKAEPRAPRKIRLADIPVTSLRQMQCEACPRNDDEKHLSSPKMRPSGPADAPVYLLGTSPSQEDDEDDMHWSDKAGRAIVKAFGNAFLEDNVRSNYLTQCRGDQTQVEVECCRGRIEEDIARVKPKVIVGIGDPPLYWATKISKGGAIPHRGTLFPVRIAGHECWYYSVLYPNFVHSKAQFSGKSSYEMALHHDIRNLKAMVEDGWFDDNPAKVVTGPYDKGIEIITGTKPGDMQRLEAALKRIAERGRSALDIETNGLRPFMLTDPMLLTCAVGTFDDVVAFSVDHPEGWGSAAQRRRVRQLLAGFISESRGRICCHNVAMELEWLACIMGNEILGKAEWDDSMAVAHTLDERRGTMGLGMQTIVCFGFDLKAQSPVDVTQPNWWLKYELTEILRYNGMDTKWTDAVFLRRMPAVQAFKVYADEYERKMRLAVSLVLIETKGLPVDFDYAADMADMLKKELGSATERLRRTPEVRKYESQKGTFDPAKDEQVLALMRDILGRSEIKRTDREGVTSTSTDEEALAAMPPDEVPSAKLILEHRGAAKLLNTYVTPILVPQAKQENVCPDGRMRPKYSMMHAITGRLSADDPAIQNWPKRKRREIRGIVSTPHWFLACDYGQIEFRVIGMASEDRNLVKYCWNDYDVHKYWAQRMMKVHGPIVDWIVQDWADDMAKIRKEKGDEDKFILKTLRQETKNGWVFPQFFGSATRSCADRMHLPGDVAEDLAKEFWDEFRGVKKWHDDTMRAYERNLYVETLSGRRRRGPLTKNEAINLPIQGTALDIVTAAQVSLTERAQVIEDPDLIPNINVHDDLTFELEESVLMPKLDIIVREMCLPRFDFVNVPLIVEASAGQRWHDLHEIQVYKSYELFGHPNPYAKEAR